MKSLVDDVVVTCDESEDTPVIIPINAINYWLIVVVLLAMACFLLLVVIVVKYCMKLRLTNPCLLLY